MARLKKFVSVVFIVFISIFICYRLIGVIGSLYIKRAVNKVSQNRVHVEKVRIGFNLHSANIRFNNVSLLIQNSLHMNAKIKTVLVRIKLRPLLDKELVCEEIIITKPNVNISSIIFRKPKTQKTTRKKALFPKKWKCVFGKIELQHGTVNYTSTANQNRNQRRNVPSKLSIKDFYLALTDFSLTRPFPFSLNGHVLSEENRTELAVSGKVLHISDGHISASVSIKNSASATPIDFTGKVILENNITSIEIEKGIYDDIKIVTPHLPLYIKDRVLHVNGVNLKVAEGEAELSGKLNFSSPYSTEFDSVYKIKNVDIQKLVSKFGIENLTFSGSLNCEGNIRSCGNSMDEIKKNLNGSLDITLNNGYLTRQHILVRMFTLINMYDVIKLRLPKMDKERIKYNIATAKAVIDSGIINVKSLYIDGERIRMSGRGDINLVKMTTDMIFGVELLQIVDEVLDKIPIVGYIITGEDGNLFAFYIKLKSSKGGRLKVTVVPYELVGDVTIRLFQRLLNLPLTMMTPVMKFIKKNGNVENKR